MEDGRYFLYIGRVEDIKGIKIVLEAWKTLGEKAPRLIVCGEGELSSLLVEELSKDTRINIEYIGQIPRDTLTRLLSSADALIQASQWYEGMPMTMIESFSVGTPVIGSNIGNVADMIQNDKMGEVFQYNNSLDLCSTVERFNATAKLRNHVRNVFEAKYSKNKNVNILLNIYKRILNR